MKNPLKKISRAIDRIISGSLGKQFLFFLAVAAAVFAILLTANVLLFSSSDPEMDFKFRFWNILLNFVDPGMGYEGYESNAERILIFITNFAGIIVFMGLLIASLTNIIEQRVDKVKNGEVYYSFNNHVVVIGFDHICDELVEQLAEKYEFVLQTSCEIEMVKRGLFNSLNEKYEKNVTVVSGSRILCSDIEKLHIDKCEQVFLLGDMDDEAHDSKNIKCLELINEFAVKRNKKLRCHVLFENPSAFAAFQQHDITKIRDNIDLVPFNFYDMWAQKVFVKGIYESGEEGDIGIIEYKPLDIKQITVDSEMFVHLIVIGMSNMGNAVGLQAAHLCHFPNFISKGIKTKITFIDEEADIKMKSLKIRLPDFFEEIDYSFVCYEEPEKNNNNKDKVKFTDIEFEFIKAHFEDDEVQDYIKKAVKEKNSYLTIAVTLQDSSASLNTALHLPACVYGTDSSVNVLVLQEHSHAIVSMLSHYESEKGIYRKYKNLRPFGMLHNCYKYNEVDELLPKMIKYVYDKTKDKEVKPIIEFDKEEIIKYWDTWSENQHDISALKASNRYAANFIWIKQRSLDIKEGIALNEKQVEYGSKMEHNRWVIEKLLVGYRAPTAEEAKEERQALKARFIHPDITAYDNLLDDEKNIDVRIYDINISNSIPFILKAKRKFEGK